MLALHLLDFALQLDLLRLHIRDVVRQLRDLRRRVPQTLDRSLQILLLLPNPIDLLRLRAKPRLQLVVFGLIIRSHCASLQKLREFFPKLLFFLSMSGRFIANALHLVDFLGHFAKPFFVFAAHTLHLRLLELHVLQLLLSPFDSVQQRVELRVEQIASHVDRVVDLVESFDSGRFVVGGFRFGARNQRIRAVRLVHEHFPNLFSSLDLHFQHRLAAQLHQRHFIFESPLILLLVELQQLRNLLVLLLQFALQLCDLLFMNRYQLS